MKRLFLMLTVAGIGLNVFGQSRQLAYEFPTIERLNSSAAFDQGVRSRSEAVNQRALENIVVDPFAYDAIITADSGGVFDDNAFVTLNTNFPDNDTFRRFDMTWAVQIFDTLLDVNTLNGYPRAITSVHLDSIDIVIAHENFTGTPDTIIFTVYAYQGPIGIQVNFSMPGDPLVNAVLYSDTVITTTSLSPSGQYSLQTIYPDIDVAGNKKFVVGVHFFGDTLNDFGLRAGYADRCGQACVAYPSINVDKTIWRMVHWQVPPGQAAQDVTGVWSNNSFSLYYDCNQDNVFPQADGCEYLFIQNFWMTSYITIDPILSASVSPPASVCPNNTVNLSVTPIGGTGPYTVTWSPTTGLDSPFSQTTNAMVTTTTTYTATVVDASSDTITKSVTITVNGITIDAGADQTINCGQTANLVATPGGVFVPSTYLWSNGVVTLNNPVMLAGTYTITATNSQSCTATDVVIVTLSGVNQTLGFTVNATNNIGCVGQALTFTNTSSSLGTEWNWRWNFGDGTQNTSQSPTYSYTQAGNYTVSLSAFSLNGSDTCSVTPSTKNLSIKAANDPACTTGIEDNPLNNLVEIYPNPTEGLFTINFKEIGKNSGVVGVYDIKGSLITEQTISIADHSQKIFDLTKVADGVYFVKIQLDDNVLMKKLTLSR